MPLPCVRTQPFAQVAEPTPDQAAEHAAALALFASRATVRVEGEGPRILLALSVVDSPSSLHPDVEATLVAAGTDERTVRDAVAKRYEHPNEDTYDRVPALWNTYLLSVPQDVPLDVVIGTLDAILPGDDDETDP